MYQERMLLTTVLTNRAFQCVTDLSSAAETDVHLADNKGRSPTANLALWSYRTTSCVRIGRGCVARHRLFAGWAQRFAHLFLLARSLATYPNRVCLAHRETPR
jgi:hypothetical protein